MELTLAEAPRLQRFFDHNPAFFVATSGEPATPTAAVEEIAMQLPAGWEFTKQWVIGYTDGDGDIAAMLSLVTGLRAAPVCHVSTFILATERHGTGDAQALHRGLERWSRDHGASWMRLGVVRGNTRAERFWRGLGYLPVRLLDDYPMGRRAVTVQLMVKPLQRGTLADYLALMPHDTPPVRQRHPASSSVG